MKLIAPQQLHQQMTDTRELALIDVRDQGLFGQAHISIASCVPASRIELEILNLLPNRRVRTVLCDDGSDDQGQARIVASRLESAGYSDVSVLDGGTDGWAAAGLVLFSGVNVPSKAFGEYVEQAQQTPHISAADLAARQQRDDDLVILDSRPMSEFEAMSIPGGVDCPGAELVYRAHVAAPNPDTTIVVNCAGRTRSIIGAQSLINAGFPNPVTALENGTMGWHLAGLEIARGETQMVSAPQGAALAFATECASKVASEYAVATITAQHFEKLKKDPDRTVYLFDVRTAEEFNAGHHGDARWVAGGQLVQSTDEYIAVRNAIIVLADDNGVRATMTASWLKQMGWRDVFVLSAQDTSVSGPWKPALLDFEAWPGISAHELKAVIDSGESCEVLDLSSSVEFNNGHIRGSWWSSRSRLTTDLAFRPEPGLMVVASPDGLLAHYCAAAVAELQPNAQIRVLDGGTAAWIRAGMTLCNDAAEQGPPQDCTDVFYKPYEHSDQLKQRMQNYLDWEVALMDQIHKDDVLDFDGFRNACRTDT